MKKILIVEDDQFLKDLYCEVLKDEGYQISHVADGEKAYQAMEKGGFDLVLLDLLLPKIDGFEILKRLKKKGFLEKNKGIFLLTNLNEETVAEKLGQIKVNDCLIKSDLTPDKLVTKVKSFLQ